MSAVSANREPLVKLLLEHGADVQATNSSGQTCLHYAVSPSSLAMTMRGACMQESNSSVGAAPHKPCCSRASISDKGMI